MKRSRSTPVVLLAGWLSLVVAPPVFGQDVSRDYYTTDPEKQRLIQSAEYHHLGKGIQFMGKGAHEQARAEFEYVLNISANHPAALFHYVSLTVDKLKRPSLAEERIERALDLNPNAGSTYVAAGYFYQKTGRIREALTMYNRGVELQPASMTGWYNLGLAYLEVRDLENANAAAQKAYALGHPLPGLRKRLEALGAWRPAASTNPSSDRPKSRSEGGLNKE